jgi:hypothetical protein
VAPSWTSLLAVGPMTFNGTNEEPLILAYLYVNKIGQFGFGWQLRGQKPLVAMPTKELVLGVPRLVSFRNDSGGPPTTSPLAGHPFATASRYVAHGEHFLVNLHGRLYGSGHSHCY